MRYQVYIVLKGHHTLIATPDGRIFVNQTGNAGLAKAGSGDVLSGIISGMVAQFSKKHDIEKILQAAVFIHGYAADLAVRTKGEASIVASDVIATIPESIRRAHGFQSTFQFT